MKFKTYKGEVLKNATISYKIDGVRAHLEDGEIVSRKGKPLYNVPKLYEVCEVFLGSWEKTVSAVRSHNGQLIAEEFLFPLSPIDSRLFVAERDEVGPEEVDCYFREAIEKGYEGLVIRSNGILYKVKDKETYDVKVTEVIPGKGKHEGRMGALMTEMGKVGTGFTDEQRNWDFLGQTIEVECMSLTPSGKFRHPRFIRLREDK